MGVFAGKWECLGVCFYWWVVVVDVGGWLELLLVSGGWYS